MHFVDPAGTRRVPVSTSVYKSMSCEASVAARFECTEAGCAEKVSGFINYVTLVECTLGGAESPAMHVVGLILLAAIFLIALALLAIGGRRVEAFRRPL